MLTIADRDAASLIELAILDSRGADGAFLVLVDADGASIGTAFFPDPIAPPKNPDVGGFVPIATITRFEAPEDKPFSVIVAGRAPLELDALGEIRRATDEVVSAGADAHPAQPAGRSIKGSITLTQLPAGPTALVRATFLERLRLIASLSSEISIELRADNLTPFGGS